MRCQRIGCLSVLVIGAVVTASGQAAKPVFEVASVKRLDKPAPFSPTRNLPRTAIFHRSNDTVASLIQFAYNRMDFEVIGGPDWIRRDQFEVSARAATEVPIDQIRVMLQALLEDRFRLVVRKEQQEMRFSALVLAREDRRLGPDLRECDVNAPPIRMPLPPGGRISSVRCGSIAGIARLAAGFLKMPVVDRTGLTGLWDHQLVFLANPNQTISGASAGSRPTAVDTNLVSFPTALQEQLGLRLEPGRGPVDVLVIDSVQQPTEN